MLMSQQYKSGEAPARRVIGLPLFRALRYSRKKRRCDYMQCSYGKYVICRNNCAEEEKLCPARRRCTRSRSQLLVILLTANLDHHYTSFWRDPAPSGYSVPKAQSRAASDGPRCQVTALDKVECDNDGRQRQGAGANLCRCPPAHPQAVHAHPCLRLAQHPPCAPLDKRSARTACQAPDRQRGHGR